MLVQAPNDRTRAQRFARDLVLVVGSLLCLGGVLLTKGSFEMREVPIVMLLAGPLAFLVGAVILHLGRPRGRRRRPIASWARAAGFTRLPLDAIDEIDVAEFESVRDAATRTGTLLCGLLGHDRIHAITGSVDAMGTNSDGEPIVVDSTGPFVAVPLPDEVTSLLPQSRFTRRSRRIDERSHLPRVPGDSRLRLESIQLDDAGELQLVGGDELAWRMAFGPELVAALAWDIDVEWTHADGWLVMHIRGRLDERVDPDVDVGLLDTLCAGAVLIELALRDAASSSLGRPIAPAQPDAWRSGIDVAARLRSERVRDLTLGIEEQLEELGRYVDAEELELVRARLATGELPAQWLDDLLHHRREAHWRRSDAA